MVGQARIIWPETIASPRWAVAALAAGNRPCSLRIADMGDDRFSHFDLASETF